jgi:hypothetical protein
VIHSDSTHPYFRTLNPAQILNPITTLRSHTPFSATSSHSRSHSNTQIPQMHTQTTQSEENRLPPPEEDAIFEPKSQLHPPYLSHTPSLSMGDEDSPCPSSLAETPEVVERNRGDTAIKKDGQTDTAERNQKANISFFDSIQNSFRTADSALPPPPPPPDADLSPRDNMNAESKLHGRDGKMWRWLYGEHDTARVPHDKSKDGNMWRWFSSHTTEVKEGGLQIQGESDVYEFVDKPNDFEPKVIDPKTIDVKGNEKDLVSWLLDRMHIENKPTADGTVGGKTNQRRTNNDEKDARNLTSDTKQTPLQDLRSLIPPFTQRKLSLTDGKPKVEVIIDKNVYYWHHLGNTLIEHWVPCVVKEIDFAIRWAIIRMVCLVIFFHLSLLEIFFFFFFFSLPHFLCSL